MKKFGYKHSIMGLLLIGSVGIVLYKTGLTCFLARSLFSVNTEIDVNERDRFGNTPLMNAVVAGNADMVRKLLQNPEVDLNATAFNLDKDPILTIACVNAANVIEMRQLEVIKLLIDAGADVNKPNAVGLRPVHACMRVGPLNLRMAIMKSLVDAGAHINAQAVDGSTVLHIAVTVMLPEWVRMMNREFGQILDYEKRQIFNLDRNMTTQFTPLELAQHMRFGQYSDTIEMALLQRPRYLGDDLLYLDVADVYGRNPLMLAMMRGDISFANNLIDAMAKKGMPLASRSRDGKTSLMYAVIGDAPLVFVKRLLADPSIKPTINDKDLADNTALLLVTYIDKPSDRIEVANLLIKAGANVNAKDKFGRTLGERARRLVDNDLVVWYGLHA